MKQIALDIGLEPTPSFTNFLTGTNEQAVKHLQFWTASSLRSPVPTYLWGESASGKTHLLKATAQALQEQGATVGWLDAANTQPGEFDERWSAVILDDCQSYSAVQQHAAFNWFVNALSAADGRPRWVLAAGRVPPADLTLREDLRTRLGWGQVFALHVLAEPERRAVLRQQADERGVFLSDAVIDFMLSRFSRDLCSLMQLLDQLDGYALQSKRAITIALLKSMLDES